MEIEGRLWYHTLVEKNKGSLFEKYKRDTLKGKLLVCLQQEGRLFSLFSNYNDFFKYQNLFKEGERCFYEVILGEYYQKDHFDIEITTKDVSKDRLDDVSNKLMEQLIISIKKEYKKDGIDLKDNDILIFSSHGSEKRSYHIVIDNYCRANVKECEQFYKTVKENVESDLTKFIDAAVYKSIQQFRMLGSQKLNSGRPKIMLKEWSFGSVEGKYEINEEWPEKRIPYMLFVNSLVSYTADCTLLKTIVVQEKKESINNDLFKTSSLTKLEALRTLDLIASNAGITRTHYRFPYELKEIEGRMIMLKRKLPSKCPICARIHEHENPFLTVGFDGSVFFNCRRNEKGLNIGKIELEPVLKKEDVVIKEKAEEKKEEKVNLVKISNKEIESIDTGILERLNKIQPPKKVKVNKLKKLDPKEYLPFLENTFFK